MIALDILEIVILFFLFAVSHTWLALRTLKRSLAEKIGNKIAFYRAFYNFSSLIFFIAFIELAPKPDVMIYDLQFPFDVITFALQVASLLGLIWATRTIDVKEFLGIGQIMRYMNGAYSIDDLDEKQEFKAEGAFKLVRHPIYLFSILFLGFRPVMGLFYFVMFICIVIYFYVGSIYEEKKLVELFGSRYLEYQSKTPRLIPLKIFYKGN